VDKLGRALRQAYPTERWQVAPFFQFGSWIGGDRDGNPFVTNDVTRRALFENRIASLRRYRQRLADLLRALSVTERAAPIAPEFREALARELAASATTRRGSTARSRRCGGPGTRATRPRRRHPSGAPGCRTSWLARSAPPRSGRPRHPRRSRPSACSG